MGEGDVKPCYGYMLHALYKTLRKDLGCNYNNNQAFTNVDAILDGDIDKLLEGVLIA